MHWLGGFVNYQSTEARLQLQHRVRRKARWRDLRDFSERRAGFVALQGVQSLQNRSLPSNPGATMEPSPAQQTLQDRIFKAMLEATFPLQTGPDQEMILQALIRAAEMLKERFEQELEELRQESD